MHRYDDIWPKALCQRKWIHVFSLGFGLGLGLWMPGTWGTLAALPFFMLLSQGGVWFYGMGWLLLLLLSVWASDQTAQALQDKDPKCVVCDEVVGWLWVLLWVPHTWLAMVLSFIAFRVFDIWKPWPIGWVDRHCSGGWGIVLDDVLAGCYVVGLYALGQCLMMGFMHQWVVTF